MPFYRPVLLLLSLILVTAAMGGPVFAQSAAAESGGGEAELILPDLRSVMFLGGISGASLLMSGLVVAALGLVFGLVIYQKLQSMPVHSSMREVSELIYE